MMLLQEDILDMRMETPGCIHHIHLNNAGAGLMPQVVVDSIVGHIELESEIGGYEAAEERQPEIEQSYASMGALIGADARNIAFVANATDAFSRSLSSIPFETGDTILTSENDYVSNQIAFISLKKRLQIEVVRAPSTETGAVDPEGLRELALKKRPRLVAITHMPTNTGVIQDVRSIGEICREIETVYLVDACQTVGQMELHVSDLHCDFLSTTSRKFLRGPRGAGFLYVADRILEMGLEPLMIDMRGADWMERDRYQPRTDARRFEDWETAYALQLGTKAAADYARGVGLANIQHRTFELAHYLRSNLQTIAGIRVLDQGDYLGGIVTLYIADASPEDLSSALKSHSINHSLSMRHYSVIDFDRKDVEWALRLSPHYYNTFGELDRTLGVISDFVKILRTA
jgi:selenocysteine lyase/cysteine desulfurase